MRSKANRTSRRVKVGRLAWGKLSVALCALALSLTAAAQTIITFDVPGALNTQPQAINNSGAITGGYRASDGTVHGFLRAPDGSLVSFDPPGSTFTFGQSINSRGEIAGSYLDAADVYHGFLRARDGSFTTFDARVSNASITGSSG